MTTIAPTPSPALRRLCRACALVIIVATPAVTAQERPEDGLVDQFVTTQDSASGFGGALSRDGANKRLGEMDRAFLLHAHQIEMLQVHAGAMALQRQTTQAVKSHARRVRQIHQASLVAIEKIARDHGVELERRFTPEFETRAHTLREADDQSFAPVFLGQMLELHERTVAHYDEAASTLDSGELRSLVKDSLPALRTQLADAEQFSTGPGSVTVR